MKALLREELEQGAFALLGVILSPGSFTTDGELTS
jgi:hypothetical protein